MLKLCDFLDTFADVLFDLLVLDDLFSEFCLINLDGFELLFDLINDNLDTFKVLLENRRCILTCQR